MGKGLEKVKGKEARGEYKKSSPSSKHRQSYSTSKTNLRARACLTPSCIARPSPQQQPDQPSTKDEEETVFFFEGELASMSRKT